MPEIIVTLEVEEGGLQVQGEPGQLSKTLFKNNNFLKRSGGDSVANVCLCIECQVPSPAISRNILR